MNSRKIREYPPIVVSVIATAIFFIMAIVSISSRAETKAEASERQQENHYAMSNATVQTAEVMEYKSTQPARAETEPEPTSTYESVVMSRDWDAEDSQMLLKIAMAEAEGESVEGKALVMLVVLNRVWSDEFPGTIEEVIFQPKQFSPVVEGGRYYTTEPNEDCYEALELVMSGWDESYGALYFESCERSSWHSENLEFLYQVGNHKFYR